MFSLLFHFPHVWNSHDFVHCPTNEHILCMQFNALNDYQTYHDASCTHHIHKTSVENSMRPDDISKSPGKSWRCVKWCRIGILGTQRNRKRIPISPRDASFQLKRCNRRRARHENVTEQDIIVDLSADSVWRLFANGTGGIVFARNRIACAHCDSIVDTFSFICTRLLLWSKRSLISIIYVIDVHCTRYQWHHQAPPLTHRLFQFASHSSFVLGVCACVELLLTYNMWSAYCQTNFQRGTMIWAEHFWICCLSEKKMFFFNLCPT